MIHEDCRSGLVMNTINTSNLVVSNGDEKANYNNLAPRICRNLDRRWRRRAEGGMSSKLQAEPGLRL